MNWIWAENIHTGSQSKRICFLFDCQYWILSVITQQFKHTVYTSTQATTCSHTHLCTRTYTWELFEAAVRNRHSNLSAQHKRPRTQERPKTHTHKWSLNTHTHTGGEWWKKSPKRLKSSSEQTAEKKSKLTSSWKKKKKKFWSLTNVSKARGIANGRELGRKKINMCNFSVRVRGEWRRGLKESPPYSGILRWKG